MHIHLALTTDFANGCIFKLKWRIFDNATVTHMTTAYAIAVPLINLSGVPYPITEPFLFADIIIHIAIAVSTSKTGMPEPIEILARAETEKRIAMAKNSLEDTVLCSTETMGGIPFVEAVSGRVRGSPQMGQ